MIARVILEATSIASKVQCFRTEIEFSCHFLLKASINNSERERAASYKDSGIRFDLKSLKMRSERPVLLEFLEAWEKFTENLLEFEKPFGYNSNRIKVNGTAKQPRRKSNEKNFSPKTKKNIIKDRKRQSLFKDESLKQKSHE